MTSNWQLPINSTKDLSPSAAVGEFIRGGDAVPTPRSNGKAPSTYAGTDITEYHGMAGASPIHGSAFDQLDPVIRDMVRSQRMRKQEQGDPAAMQDVDQFRASTKSTVSSQSAAGGAAAVGRARAGTGTESEWTTRDSTSTGPTVKELLTPLADRMQRIHTLSDAERSRAVRAINFDDDDVNLPPQQPRRHNDVVLTADAPRQQAQTAAAADVVADADDDSYTLEMKKDLAKLQYDDSSSSTMVTDTSSGAARHGHTSNGPATTAHASFRPDDGDSRYSVTDYFQKYPDAANKSGRKQMLRQREDIQNNTKKATQPARDQNGGGKMIDSAMQERIGKWAEQVVFSPNGVPMIFEDADSSASNPNPVPSPQVELYRGTDLDTSISTINDRTMSCDRESAATTTGSVSSVDDRIFRQGLANLDANIERVQKSLRSAMH